MALLVFSILLIVPPLSLVIIFVLSPELLLGSSELNASFIWSTAGTSLSYLGFLFSAYALFEIRSLSKKYFFKNRSPEIQKNLNVIAKSMSDFEAEHPKNLQSQKFMSEIPSIMRLSRRLKNSTITKVSKEIDKLHKEIINHISISRLPETSGKLPGYWRMHSKIQELSVELKTQTADMKAM